MIKSELYIITPPFEGNYKDELITIYISSILERGDQININKQGYIINDKHICINKDGIEKIVYSLVEYSEDDEWEVDDEHEMFKSLEKQGLMGTYLHISGENEL